MPKNVDHDARRRELVTAALHLVATSGKSAASVRAIAAETGWSPGSVRHYLPNSQVLETLLLEHVAAQVQRRVAECVASGRALPREELVAQMAEQILPADAERLVEHRVWLALYVAEPDSAVELRWAWEGTRMFHRQLVLLLQGAETVPNHPGPLSPELETWAGHLQAYTDGLSLRMASATEPVDRSLADLRAFLAVVAAATNALPARNRPAPAEPSVPTDSAGTQGGKMLTIQ